MHCSKWKRAADCRDLTPRRAGVDDRARPAHLVDDVIARRRRLFAHPLQIDADQLAVPLHDPASDENFARAMPVTIAP